MRANTNFKYSQAWSFTCLLLLSSAQAVGTQNLDQKKTFNPLRSVFLAKPAIPTRHISRKDATGRELAPNELIRLANGKQIRARDYFGALNRLEAALNAKGYSLTSGPAVEKIGVIQTDAAAVRKIQADLDGIAKKKGSSPPGTDTRTFPGVQTTSRDWQTSWNPHMGPFGVSVTFENQSSAFSKLKSDPTKSDLIGLSEKLTGNISATVMDQNLPLVGLVGQASLGGGPLQSIDTPPQIAAGLQIGGNNVWGFERKPDDPLEFKGSQSFPFDVNANATFDVAGIVIVGKAGVMGSAGYSYDLGVKRLEAFANGEAYVKASAYAQGGVGLGFEVSNYGVAVDGGLKINLLLIDEKLDAGASLSLGQQGKKIGIQDQLKITNNVTALRGQVDAFIHANGGLFDKEFDYPLFDWPGFSSNATLLDESDFVPLLSK